MHTEFKESPDCNFSESEQTLLAVALERLEQGFSPLPAHQVYNDDGSIARDAKGHKLRPVTGPWKDFQTTPITPEELQKRIREGTYSGQMNSLCLIMGTFGEKSSTMLDCDSPEYWEPFKALIEGKHPGILKKGVIESAVSSKYHWYFLAPESEPNMKLSYGAAGGEEDCIFETRGGNKGFSYTYPTAGYDIVSGSFDSMVTLTQEEYEDVLETAHSFNEDPNTERLWQERLARRRGETPETETESAATTDSDAFDLAEDWSMSDALAEWESNNALLLKASKNKKLLKRAARYVILNARNKPAISGHNGHSEILRVARMLCYGMALPDEESLPLLRFYNNACQPPFSESELAHKFAEAHNPEGAPYEKGFFRQHTLTASGIAVKATDDGGVKKTLVNAVKLLQEDPDFAGLKFNVLINSYEFFSSDDDSLSGPLDDEKRSHIKWIFDERYGWDISDNMLTDALNCLAGERRVNPFLDWVQGLKWDGIQRVEKAPIDILDAEDNALSRCSLKYPMRAVLARQAFKEPPLCDYMVIFQGEQGTGKSELIRRLAPDPKFFSNSLTVQSFCDSKLCVERTLGAVICELGELAGFRKAEDEAVKSALSLRSRIVRLAYAKEPKAFRQMFTLFGTTNEAEFLRDSSGARRFFIVKSQLPARQPRVFDIMTPYYREQLWAEMWQDFLDHSAEPDYLLMPQEAVDLATLKAEECYVEDSYTDAVRKYMCDTTICHNMTLTPVQQDEQTITFDVSSGAGFVTAYDIWKHGLHKNIDLSIKLNPADFSQSDRNRIVNIVKNIPYWERCRQRKGGSQVWGWKLRPLQVIAPRDKLTVYELRQLEKNQPIHNLQYDYDFVVVKN